MSGYTAPLDPNLALLPGWVTPVGMLVILVLGIISIRLIVRALSKPRRR